MALSNINAKVRAHLYNCTIEKSGTYEANAQSFVPQNFRQYLPILKWTPPILNLLFRAPLKPEKKKIL
jgi:hypothetical protein